MGRIKQAYWSALATWQRCWRPQERVLSPHPWMDAIERFIPPDQEKVVYVDGGAHDGTMAKKFLDRFAQLEVYAFEPNSDLFPKLEANLADVPGNCFAAALAAQSGQTTMYINQSPMTSSLLGRSNYSERYFDQFTRTKEVRTIEVTTLDDWFDYENPGQVDILKLDLQGYEAQALRGGRRLLDKGIRCIYTEVNFVPLYEGSALFGDVDSILRQHGYRLHNLYNLATKEQDWQLNGGDALYVLDRTPSASTLRKAA